MGQQGDQIRHFSVKPQIASSSSKASHWSLAMGSQRTTSGTTKKAQYRCCMCVVFWPLLPSLLHVSHHVGMSLFDFMGYEQ